MNRRPRSVLFDLDGTLVDSSPQHDRAFRTAIAAHRPEWLAEFRYEPLQGLTTEEAFSRLGERDPDALKKLVSAKREAFASLGGLRAFPGAIALLADLSRRGVGVFVVTSAARASAMSALRATGLAMYVRGLIAAEDAPEGKPSPALYLAALKRFGLRARDSIVIEDSAAGIASARAAGMRVVRVHGRFDPSSGVEWCANFAALRRVLM
jgi:HAD superfamily hydrolase (TIGR01509 family)